MENTQVSDRKIIDMMERYGGGFATNLARAWRLADSDNSARLAKAFPELWDQYRFMALQEMKRQG